MVTFALDKWLGHANFIVSQANDFEVILGQ
jgi:hypothetical protein